MDSSDDNQATIERYVVDKVVSHRSGPGRKSIHNYTYRLRLKGYDPESDLSYRADEIPQCQEMIAAYRANNSLDAATTQPKTSESLNNKPKRKRNEN